LLNKKLNVSEDFLDVALKSSSVDYLGIEVVFLLLCMIDYAEAPPFTMGLVILLFLFESYGSYLTLYEILATASPLMVFIVELICCSAYKSMSSRVFRVTSPITELSSRRKLLMVMVVAEV
jgi:hypothetical protein